MNWRDAVGLLVSVLFFATLGYAVLVLCVVVDFDRCVDAVGQWWLFAVDAVTCLRWAH